MTIPNVRNVLVITSKEIYLNNFLLHENVEFHDTWKKRRYLDPDLSLTNNASEYSDSVLRGKCLPGCPLEKTLLCSNSFSFEVKVQFRTEKVRRTPDMKANKSIAAELAAAT